MCSKVNPNQKLISDDISLKVKSDDTEEETIPTTYVNFGIALGVMAGCCWGLQTTLVGQGMLHAPLDNDKYSDFDIANTSTFLYETFCACFSSLAVLVLVLCGKRKTLFHDFNRYSLFYAILAGITASPLGVLFFVNGMTYIGSSYATAISALYPVVGAVINNIFLGERIYSIGWIGLVMAVIGAATISLSAIFFETQTIENPVMGIIFVMIAVFGWGTECVILQHSFRRYKLNGLVAFWIRELTSFVFYSCILFPVRGIGQFQFYASIFGTTPMYYIMAGALSGTTSCVAYFLSIDFIGATKAMAINGSFAAWAVVFGCFFGQFPASILSVVISIILISVGAFFCAGLGKEPMPILLMKSWLGKCSEEELETLRVAQEKARLEQEMINRRQMGLDKEGVEEEKTLKNKKTLDSEYASDEDYNGYSYQQSGDDEDDFEDPEDIITTSNVKRINSSD